MTAMEDSLTADQFQVVSVSHSQRLNIENNVMRYMSAWQGVAPDTEMSSFDCKHLIRACQIGLLEDAEQRIPHDHIHRWNVLYGFILRAALHHANSGGKLESCFVGLQESNAQILSRLNEAASKLQVAVKDVATIQERYGSCMDASGTPGHLRCAQVCNYSG